MVKNKTGLLPEFQSLDELAKFFDEHDLGDYLERMPEVAMEVDIRQETLVVTLDKEMAGHLDDIARARQTSVSILVKDWLHEKIMESTSH